MRRNWPAKDPAATEAYDFDWAPLLGEGETITGSTAASEDLADGGPVVVGQVTGGAIQQVRLSGGTVRSASYAVLLGITTSLNNTPKRRVRIKIRNR